MYLVEIDVKAKDATTLPPQHIMERTAEFMAEVIAAKCGESEVFVGKRMGGAVDADGDIDEQRMLAVWASVDGDTLEAVFQTLWAAAATIAAALEQCTVSFLVVDVAGSVQLTPCQPQVVPAA